MLLSSTLQQFSRGIVHYFVRRSLSFLVKECDVESVKAGGMGKNVLFLFQIEVGSLITFQEIDYLLGILGRKDGTGGVDHFTSRLDHLTVV